MDARQLSFWEDDGIMFLDEDFSSDDEPEEFGFFTDVPQSVLDAYVPEDYPPTEELEEFSEEKAFGIIKSMTVEEMDVLLGEIHEKKQQEKRELSYQKEIPSLIHLAKELKLTRKEEMLVEALRLARNGNGYRTITVPKKNGEGREINIPADILKRVQRRINKHLLSYFQHSQNIFGFSGGSIVEAITPHLKAKSILCVDVMDAFPSVKFDDVFDYLIEGRTVVISGYYRDRHRYGKVHDYGYFSWYVARIIADLTTFKGRLPQGAPTSPRMFDLMCRNMDKALTKLAASTGGTYTRYADNIFFSMDEEEFPRPIRQAILKIIENREFSSYPKHKHRHPGPYFDWHKLKVRRVNDGNTVRLLGLNIIEGKIHNTRDFKRRLRLSIHHLNWLSRRGLEGTEQFKTAWLKLQGQMAFARTDTLPPKLVEAYSELQKRLT
ncbi:MAG: reverse transcriptase family protein [Candidatus Pacebacteria bacterium]|nr:reverse transcriptase family protein [Candidatus Paceibacterota bacterium]